MRHFFVLFAALMLSASPAIAATARDEFVKTLPENQEDPHSRTKLTDIWTQASRKSLGNDEDEVKVRVISIQDNARIITVRWISAEIAIAQCENTNQRFLAFFIKEDGKWTFVRQYKMGVVRSKS